MLFGMYLVFFFKQKTAYDMRISDWSSDVCSSDLFFIVEARFYDHLNDMLVAGAKAALKAAGHAADVITVPGALEIPAAISLADAAGDYDGYVAIEYGREPCRERAWP